MKKLTTILAGLSALALASTANAQTVQINYTGTPTAIPALNDFQAQLAGLGQTRYTTTGITSLVLSGPASLSFEFLGSESGFSDRFTIGTGAFYTENSSFSNNFGSPILIGFQNYMAGGNIGTDWNFTTTGMGFGGMNSAFDSAGFGIFLGPNQTSGQSVSTFYLGYDDQIVGDDDNHDDFIVRVRVNAPVPEPSTWAMMLVGFGAVGYGMRRRTRKVALQAA